MNDAMQFPAAVVELEKTYQQALALHLEMARKVHAAEAALRAATGDEYAKLGLEVPDVFTFEEPFKALAQATGEVFAREFVTERTPLGSTCEAWPGLQCAACNEAFRGNNYRHDRPPEEGHAFWAQRGPQAYWRALVASYDPAATEREANAAAAQKLVWIFDLNRQARVKRRGRKVLLQMWWNTRASYRSGARIADYEGVRRIRETCAAWRRVCAAAQVDTGWTHQLLHDIERMRAEETPIASRGRLLYPVPGVTVALFQEHVRFELEPVVAEALQVFVARHGARPARAA